MARSPASQQSCAGLTATRGAWRHRAVNLGWASKTSCPVRFVSHRRYRFARAGPARAVDRAGIGRCCCEAEARAPGRWTRLSSWTKSDSPPPRVSSTQSRVPFGSRTIRAGRSAGKPGSRTNPALFRRQPPRNRRQPGLLHRRVALPVFQRRFWSFFAPTHPAVCGHETSLSTLPPPRAGPHWAALTRRPVRGYCRWSAG
jgi:hypothetical protein